MQLDPISLLKKKLQLCVCVCLCVQKDVLGHTELLVTSQSWD